MVARPPRCYKCVMQTDVWVSRLKAAQSPERLALVDAFVAHALGRPLSFYIDATELGEVIVAAVTSDSARWLVDRHLSPGWDRQLARAEEGGETLGAYLDDDSRAGLIECLSQVSKPPLTWAENAVDPKLVRQLLAPVVQGLLLGFARRLPLLGKAAAEDSVLGGLAGRVKRGVEKRAEKIASVGKSVMGGLGAEMDKRVSATAKEFSEVAVGELRDAIAARLASEEGRAIVAEMRTRAIDAFLSAPISALMKDAECLPRERLEALVPGIVGHVGLLPFFRAAVAAEVRALLAAEGDVALRDLLAEHGLLDRVRAVAVRQGEALLGDFLAGDAFAGWLRDVARQRGEDGG